jgi:hypothetical protein
MHAWTMEMKENKGAIVYVVLMSSGNLKGAKGHKT